MIGESETISRTFTAVKGGLFWVFGFAAIFLMIALIASLQTGTGRNVNLGIPAHSNPRVSGEGAIEDAPSIGLSPDVVNTDSNQQ